MDSILFGGYVPASWDLTDYYDGEVLERFRCEISLPQRNSWNDFVIMEFRIPEVHSKCDLLTMTLHQ